MVDVLIRKLERYAQLSDEEKQALTGAPSRVEVYRRDQDIVREGDCPPESCIVLEGFACRYKGLAGGTRQILSIHIPGDFCDLHSFYLKVMDHAIGALGPCRVAKVPHDTLKGMLEKYPTLARALSWDVAVDGAIQREWMVSMGRRSAFEQFAHLMCELALRLQSVGLAPGDTYELPTTQADLGDAFGLSTVHVNRVLQELRAKGLVIWKGKLVTIPDIEALKEAAGFEPTYLQVRGGAEH